MYTDRRYYIVRYTTCWPLCYPGIRLAKCLDNNLYIPEILLAVVRVRRIFSTFREPRHRRLWLCVCVLVLYISCPKYTLIYTRNIIICIYITVSSSYLHSMRVICRLSQLQVRLFTVCQRIYIIYYDSKVLSPFPFDNII